MVVKIIRVIPRGINRREIYSPDDFLRAAVYYYICRNFFNDNDEGAFV